MLRHRVFDACMRRASRAGAAACAAILASVLALFAAGCAGEITAPGGDGSTVVIPDEDGQTATASGTVELAVDRCDDATLLPSEDNLARIRAATLCLVNAERTERDVPPLSSDGELRKAAVAKARDMVDRVYFAHVGPDDRDVRDWVGETDYVDAAQGYRLGENLGWASEGAATPAQLVEGWMRSPGHRENILREAFEDSGIGVVLGAPRDEGGGGATYVQVFGTT